MFVVVMPSMALADARSDVANELGNFAPAQARRAVLAKASVLFQWLENAGTHTMQTCLEGIETRLN